jgi:hypothetical protein
MSAISSVRSPASDGREREREIYNEQFRRLYCTTALKKIMWSIQAGERRSKTHHGHEIESSDGWYRLGELGVTLELKASNVLSYFLRGFLYDSWKMKRLRKCSQLCEQEVMIRQPIAVVHSASKCITSLAVFLEAASSDTQCHRIYGNRTTRIQIEASLHHSIFWMLGINSIHIYHACSLVNRESTKRTPSFPPGRCLPNDIFTSHALRASYDNTQLLTDHPSNRPHATVLKPRTTPVRFCFSSQHVLPQ